MQTYLQASFILFFWSHEDFAYLLSLKWKLRFTWNRVTPGNGASQWKHFNTTCEIPRPGRCVWDEHKGLSYSGEKGEVCRPRLYPTFRPRPSLYHQGNFPIAATGIMVLLLFKGYHPVDFCIKHFPGMSNANLASNRGQGVFTSIKKSQETLIFFSNQQCHRFFHILSEVNQALRHYSDLT